MSEMTLALPIQSAVQEARQEDARREQQFLAEALRLSMEAAVRLVDYDTARDVSDAVVLRLWKRRQASPDFLSQQGELGAYLYRAVANCVFNTRRDELRQRRRDVQHAGAEQDRGDPAPSWMDPEAARAEKELSRTVARAVDAMPARAQDVYRRIRDDGASYKEVAEELGISVNTVRNHLVHAHQLLRAALEREA